MDEHITPARLAMMPTLFRLTSLQRQPLSDKGYKMEATLFHEKASLGVGWTVRQPDTRLKQGLLVTPYYTGQLVCDAGRIRIARLAPAEIPQRNENLFDTVPPQWVKDRTLVRRAAVLWEKLPFIWQDLFNRVVWQGERFHGICVGPGSLTGHHSERNGNFRHMVETGEAVLALLPQHPAADPDIALFIGLVHDFGKAVEYMVSSEGWAMSDIGSIRGHKNILGDWLAEARKGLRPDLPELVYHSMRHALEAVRNVPFESGLRQPMTPEAKLLSLADQSSGSGDLFARQVAPAGGWGKHHPHMGSIIPFSVGKNVVQGREVAHESVA